MPKLTPDGEVLDAFITAQKVAFVALVRCLEDNRALKPGQIASALRMAMENGRSDLPDMTLANLFELREAVME